MLVTLKNGGASVLSAKQFNDSTVCNSVIISSISRSGFDLAINITTLLANGNSSFGAKPVKTNKYLMIILKLFGQEAHKAAQRSSISFGK